MSIAECALADCALQCWDNSTRGLDSATAMEFVKSLKMSGELAKTTSMVAIYQASQDAYDAFTKVTVLYEGRQIYFGPVEHAREFFINMGFHCPERAATADFLTSLTSPSERQISPGYETRVPRTPDEFVTAWKNSKEYRELIEEIDEYNKTYPISSDAVATFQQSRKAQQSKRMRTDSPYTISIPMQIKLCTVRGFQRLNNDLSLFFTMVFGNIGMALIIASVFYNLPETTGSFFSRGALLFFAILMNAFSSMLEVRFTFLIYLDSHSLRSTSHCRKASKIRFLSSVY